MSRFTAIFLDAIDLLVRGLRSGLPISESLGIVSRELPDPVGTEFRAITDRIRIGRTMEQALQETADRLGTPEFQFFVITLAIQRETGGNQIGRHTSELRSLMRISYAVLCLKKKKDTKPRRKPDDLPDRLAQQLQLRRGA